MTAVGTHLDTTHRTGLVGAVVVARMKSSRLPGKSMIDIAGTPSLGWLVRRLSASRHIQKFVFATTTDPADDNIAQFARQLGHEFFRGSEQDVLGRVLGAAQSAGLDTIVHVNGDCPLLDPKLADELLEFYWRKQLDYARLDPGSYPLGFNIEVFSTEALVRLESSFEDPWIREHVTEPFYTMPDRFRAADMPAPPELYGPQYRLCIDTTEDYRLVQQIFDHFLPEKEDFGSREIVALLKDRPDLLAINAAVKQVKYRCAVIGLGRIGACGGDTLLQTDKAQTHADAYLRYGRAHLAALCDTDSSRRERCVEKWKIQTVYSSAEELFNNQDVDIVSIATPPQTHAELCSQALQAGVRAIFCEKPFVGDPGSGRQIIEACRRRGALLTVNHWMRWSPLYRNLHEFIRSGGIGTVQCVRCHYSKGAMNSGTHAVDLLHYLFGLVKSARATESLALDTQDDNLGGVLQMVAGFPVHLMVSDYRAHFTFECDVIGSGGRLQVLDDQVSFWLAKRSNQEDDLRVLHPATVPFDTHLGSPFESALAELVAYLDRGEGTAACTGADGLRAVQVILALQRSWSSGGEVVEMNYEEMDDT